MYCKKNQISCLLDPNLMKSAAAFQAVLPSLQPCPHLKSVEAELSLIVQLSTPPGPTPPDCNLKSKQYILCSSLLWKTTIQEDNSKGKQPQRKMTSNEDDLTGRPPH